MKFGQPSPKCVTDAEVLCAVKIKPAHHHGLTAAVSWLNKLKSIS